VEEATREYRLELDGFKAVKKRVILRIVVTLLLALGIVSYFSYPDQIDPVMAGVMLVIMILVGAHSIHEAIHRERVKWLSYCLTIDGDTIGRRIDGMPAVNIDRSEITKIEEGAGGLTLRTAQSQVFVHVPSALQSYAEVRKTFMGIAPIVAPSRIAGLASYAIVAAIFLALYFGIMSPERWIRVATVGVGCLFGIWCFISIQRDPNQDKSVKTASWVFLAIVLSIVAQVAGNLLK